MIKRVLVDSDVILDIALAREPFLNSSRSALALLETGKALGYVSANSVGNIYYILRKSGGDEKARQFINIFLKFLMIVPSDHQCVLNALNSGFSDFEDAIQNFTAIDSQCDCILTRNIEDFRKSEIDIFLPLELLSLYE